LVRTSEVVDLIAQEAGITKKAAAMALKSVVKAIQDSLNTTEAMIRIPDLGTFRVIEKKERMGTNPKTGEKIKIPGGKSPKFSASAALKKLVAEGG
jgi:DNA-binding protein HU-beta